MAYEQDGINQIEVNELLEIYEVKSEETVLLDVREQDEYNEGHIPGVKFLPMSEFVERYEKELDSSKKYVVICRSGNRSQKVCRFLQDQGFADVTNYAGGMLEWMGDIEK
ncbi:rhodanese-like domain-containing protein [Caldalkalibacillus mannanilyticus]|uniref:rhodanese-like domain-containing protein n=1 Tax=Caldalkalibacillus mannanilyticus TaxID=1418 RepID=UPI0005566847|nr:rhodanese-like domain-containing protein [Caldalkalibacillus mannanilyticus]